MKLQQLQEAKYISVDISSVDQAMQAALQDDAQDDYNAYSKKIFATNKPEFKNIWTALYAKYGNPDVRYVPKQRSSKSYAPVGGRGNASPFFYAWKFGEHTYIDVSYKMMPRAYDNKIYVHVYNSPDQDLVKDFAKFMKTSPLPGEHIE